MPSTALLDRHSVRAARLDRLGGLSGSDVLTESLVVRLTSEFQGFARDLHDETVSAVLGVVTASIDTARLLRAPYVASRRLERGNADPGALSDDFGLFGLDLWPELAGHYPGRGPAWNAHLRALLRARNGIAHDDPDQPARLRAAGWELDRSSADRWRIMLDELAAGMDTVVAQYVARTYGRRPW